MDIDPDGPVPVYIQIADTIQARIERGDYPKGRRIPSESALQQETGTARATVRHAIDELRRRDLVYTVPMRGTFVGTPPK
ncbi:MAG TPA: winged helix-turn-helix domain-containing protein [Actinocatenispora sp.]